MEFETKKKPRALGCLLKGPGPQYKLKTLIGFDDHDPSRHRNPAYSIGVRPKARVCSTGPGPYPIVHHLTNRGLELPPAYTMAFKSRQIFKSMVPGPGAYATHKIPPVNHQRRAAAYTILTRHDKIPYKPGPGPIYMLPTCIGPEIPDVRAEGAYSMTFKRKQRVNTIGPGPAAYVNVPVDLFKRHNPAYSMKFRHEPFDFTRHIPGPQYSFNTNSYKKRPPMYSFGLRHSECTTVGILPEDQI